MKMLKKSCVALLTSAFLLLGLSLCQGAAKAANYVVSKTADSIDGVCDSDCSLREAVSAANDDATASTITFNPTVFAAPRKTLTTTYSVNITQDVTITAPAAGVVLQAGNNGNIISVTEPGATANFTGLSFVGGNTAVENDGTVNLTNCTLSGSTYGFINYGSAANLINCTISGSGTYGIDNGSSGGSGGSSGSGSGGGGSPSALTLTNCTVAGNGTGINNAYGSVVTVKNSIVAGNSTHLSGFSDPLTDGGNNILNGTAAAAGLDPLGLQDNGGPSRTIALLSNSPAIDAANNANAPAKDQRGIARPQGARSDIGAYEAMLSIVIRDAAASEGNSGTTNFVFTINLLRTSANAVTVSYATANGTATAGTDYTAKTGSITIPAGQTSATITVVGNGDTAREPDETFFVNLSNPVNAPISDAQGIGTIIADDFETPSLVVNTISNVQSKTDGVTSLSDAIEYANDGSGGTITFNPTVFAAPRKTILVTNAFTFFKNINITGPASGVTIEGNTPQGFGQLDHIFHVRNVGANFENLTVSKGRNGILNNAGNVNLTNCTLSNNTESGFYGAYGSSALTNCTFNGNSIGLTLFNTSTNLINCTVSGNSTFGIYNSEGNATLSSCTVSGNATGISSNIVSQAYKFTLKNSIVAGNSTNTAGVITYGVNNIAAGTAASAGLETNSAGQPVLKDNDGPTQTIALTPGGAAIDAAENASSPATDQRGYARPWGTRSDIGAFEYAPIVLVIRDVTANEGNSGTTNFVFTVKLMRASANDVTVNYATANGTATAGTDYTAQSGTLTIPAGAFGATITIAVKGDLAYEPNETFFVNLSNAVNAPISDGQGVGTINTDEFETPSLVVTSTGDVVDNTDGGNSLREAMNFANEDGVNSAVTFSPTAFAAPRKTITLRGEQLPLILANGTMSITAPLAGVVVSGNNLSGVFEVGSSTSVTFTGLTISGGIESGIRNYGTLLVNSCTLSGNSSYAGGGIYSQDNYTGGSLTVRNSTLSGNSASEGGAIYSSYSSTRIESSTITSNSAPNNGGAGIACAGDMFDDTIIIVQNSIISGNIGTDVDYVFGNQNSDQIRSEGNNLIGDGSATDFFYEGGDVSGNTDPGLGTLGENGGPTRTHALLPGSPALGGGNTNLTTDQRGKSRPSGLADDIGAFDADAAQSGASLVVNSLADTDDGVCGTENCTLREAIRAAFSGGQSSITFSPTIFATKQTIVVSRNLPTLEGIVSITAPPAGVIIKSAPSYTGILFVNVDGQVRLVNLTIETQGTGVSSGIGDTQVIGCTFKGGKVGVFIANGTARVQNSTITGLDAGILQENGTLVVQNCTISRNTDGIKVTGGSLTLTNSIVAGNSGQNISGSVSLSGPNITSGDAGLDTLKNNGGPTETFALLPGSPAINTGNTPLSTDQRGTSRPQGSADDIGAFELQSPPAPNAAPVVVVPSPAWAITSTAEQARQIVTTVSDPNGAGDILESWLQINSRDSWTNSVTAKVERVGAGWHLNLRSDNGAAWLVVAIPVSGARVTLSNSQGTVSVGSGDITQKGNNVRVAWQVSLRGAPGARTIWAYAVDLRRATSTTPYNRIGTWTLNNSAPSVDVPSPAWAIASQVGQSRQIVTTVSDPNGGSDILESWIQVHSSSTLTGSVTAKVERVGAGWRLNLRSDNGATWLVVAIPTSGARVTLSNSQGTVSVGSGDITQSGNSVRVKWQIVRRTTGAHSIWAHAVDLQRAASAMPFDRIGSWTASAASAAPRGSSAGES